jgi:hypothetical protein
LKKSDPVFLQKNYHVKTKPLSFGMANRLACETLERLAGQAAFIARGSERRMSA